MEEQQTLHINVVYVLDLQCGYTVKLGYIKLGFFTNTWCISKCYQGPNITPFTSMINKLGYIELYISKTQIYRSFSEVPCHWNQCKLPFIYQSSKSSDQNQLNILSFVINWHFKVNWHFSVSWETYTIHISNTLNTLKAINISQFRYTAWAPLFILSDYSNSFMIEENNDWIIFHSVVIIMQTHQV